jgi:AcrR family transcriptional regulator
VDNCFHWPGWVFELMEQAPTNHGSGLGRISKLQPGRQKLPREVIEHYQRRRAATALAAIAHEDGITELTVARITKKARMAGGTFYKLFENKSECFEFACEEARERLFGPVRAAAEREGPWFERLDEAIGGFLEAAAGEPFLAELYLVHSPALMGGVWGLDHKAGIETLVEVVSSGRAGGADGWGKSFREPPEGIEELIACGIVAAVSLRLRRGEALEPTRMRAELGSYTAEVLVGVEEAERCGREKSRSTPDQSSRVPADVASAQEPSVGVGVQTSAEITPAARARFEAYGASRTNKIGGA